MGKIDGFIEYKRQLPPKESVSNRITHFNEFIDLSEKVIIEQQSARCMDCGVAFCHSACPLGNRIPEFNDAVYRQQWEQAYKILISTNNFPEFTGRICPAPCEGSCVLGINNDPVTIEEIEKSITEIAFENNWVKVNTPLRETNHKVAIIGSGPAGLACADELRAQGHQVTVYEKADRIGGLLRYGIPDFKLEKSILDRRLNLMKEAGVQFETGVTVGHDIDPAFLLSEYDATVLCIGSTVPRDLAIEGRNLEGIYFAMDFLTEVNRFVAGEQSHLLDCRNKDILVIGGGDTGSDCIGSAHRLGAKSVTQLELMGKPPTTRSEDNPWPQWPMILRTSSSHEEGAERYWAVATKRFISDDGVRVSGVETVKVQWEKTKTGSYEMKEIQNSQSVILCDVVFLAIGFLHPLIDTFFSGLNIALDRRQNIKTNGYKTSVDKLFAAGDARMGQSLVVHAIAEGRKVAQSVDAYLNKDAEQQVGVDLNPYSL